MSQVEEATAAAAVAAAEVTSDEKAATNREATTMVGVSQSLPRALSPRRNVTPAGHAGSPRGASSPTSAAAGSRAEIRRQHTKQRLEMAARYTGAGLAVSSSFVVEPSRGVESLWTFLTCRGVQCDRWGAQDARH